MLKALLIVTALSGAEYTAQFSSMQECLEAKKVVQQQDENIKTLCVPTEDERAKIENFFGIFLDMMYQLKEMDMYNNEYGERYGHNREENRFGPYGTRKQPNRMEQKLLEKNSHLSS